MVYLIIDTASSCCRMALLTQKGSILASIETDTDNNHSEQLLYKLDSLLKKTDIEPHLIDLISVNIGPGRYTGIRAGISMAQGLSLGWSVPCVGVSLFSALAYDALPLHPSTPIAVVLKAFNKDFYVQYFSVDLMPLSDPCVRTKVDLCNEIDRCNRQMWNFIGSDLTQISASLSDTFNKKLLYLKNCQVPSFLSLAFLARRSLKHVNSTITPLYIVPPNALKSKPSPYIQKKGA